ncbi:methyl-accepting chemotaxis protein [Magnetospirillum aberrantis]|uniref:methyl-accepting chemotaxis protein n=1 Tax=Magnetospirillum aberrantis TaxID=1105283 RepID=UPI0030B814CB
MTDDATTIDEVIAPVASPARFSLPSWFKPLLVRLGALWRHGEVPGLANISIGRRLALLGVLALIGAASFGVAYHLAERRIDSMLVTQDGYRRLNDLAGDVRAKVAALQNHQEQFLRERDEARAKDFRQDVAFVARSLDAMRALPEAAGMASNLAELSAGVAAAAQRFEAVSHRVGELGASEAQGLRGRLAASVKAVEDELKMWPNAGPLIPEMLQMRQAEKNFMLYGGETYLNQHRQHANQFDFALDASSLPPSTRDDFRKLLAAYGDDMQAFAAGTMALGEDVADLRRQFRALQPTLNQVFAYAREGMASAIAQQEEVRAATSRLLALFGVMAVLSFGAAVLVLARSVTQPVRMIEEAMERLAAGDHGVTVPGIARRDEIGDMAKAVAVFKDNAIAMVRMQQEQDAIRAEAEATSRQRLMVLADRFEGAVKSVADSVNRNAQAITATAEGMVRHEGNGENRSLSVAEAADQARRTVVAVAEAADDLAASVGDISALAAETSRVVRQAVSELDRTNARVRGLSEVAGNIDRVVNLIGDIAARTNMLSLNATIEAQRAGEAGRGFAVVAGEVKHLAQKTSESTREIADQIAAIQSATAETVSAIGDVGSAVRRMDEIAAQVAEAVNRQGGVTDKISRCVDQVRHDTACVTEGVVSVTQSAARYCGAAVRVMWAADDLAGPAANLKDEVDGFLRTIRA